ncbi:hypothetical protein [Arthrobacter glacialis]|uniref:Uncharacterized protein n=1 Tax=Arthrobacter glacialis TaxID=1664 RepID=A0A2S3ZY85_ARTGL|nr:hypothetical protein [Arthrobacter glacialis]POH56859.1 hypothetical protein CVS28_18765 [Arthrobacter glacialis]POH74245.1 hypothetical protein CVS27_06690 [Arthrobacter glacialis]
MTSKDRTASAPDNEPLPPVAGENVASAKARPAKRTVGAAVGTAVAAATLAAVTVLSGPALAGASASGLNSGSIISSPPNSASSRIAGVHEDMARAVQLGQITASQAAFLENQLVKRIQPGV